MHLFTIFSHFKPYSAIFIASREENRLSANINCMDKATASGRAQMKSCDPPRSLAQKTMKSGRIQHPAGFLPLSYILCYKAKHDVTGHGRHVR